MCKQIKNTFDTYLTDLFNLKLKEHFYEEGGNFIDPVTTPPYYNNV